MRKKQKLFFLGFLGKTVGSKLLNGTLIGTSLWGVKQGSDAQKQQEEANEEAAREQRRHNKAMEEAAKQDPSVVQKDFAALPGSVMRGLVKGRQALRAVQKTKAGGFASDLLSTQKGNIKNAVGTAAGFAGLGYVGNRVATSVKDHRENNDEGNKDFLKKAALTTAAVGGSILAARKGAFGTGAQKFMTTGKGGSALKALSPIVRDEKTNKVLKGQTATKLGVNAAFAAMPTVSYLAQNKSKDDMVNNTQTQDQKEYSVLNYLKPKTIKAGWNVLKSHPAQSISGGINKATQFFNFYGKGGTKNVQNTVSELAKAGQKSGNVWTQKTADYLGKHKTAANLLATGGAAAVGGAAMKLGNAAVEKPARMIDEDAYKMEDQQNDKI